MNQTLHCLVPDPQNIREWEILFPTIEMVINSLHNRSTGFSLFFLNYGYEPVMPIQLLKSNETISTEMLASFIRKVTSDWELRFKFTVISRLATKVL